MTKGTGAGSGVRPIWMTSTMDGAEHAIMDEQMTAGLAAGRGVYAALCGAQVIAASLAAPPGRRCARCVAFLRARASLRDLASPAPAQRWWRKQMLGWRRG